MRTSVIILTRDRFEDLIECLDSLSSQTIPPDEVILLDNSSNTVTFDYGQSALHRLPFRLIYLRGDPSLGTASGRNRAIGEAQGDIILFLDDDVVLTDREYIATILCVFEADSSGAVGGVSARVTGWSRWQWLAYSARIALKIPFLLDGLRPGRILRSGFRSWYPNDTEWVQCLPSCTAAFRRGVFNDYQFDPGFETMPYAIAEDQDFSYRVGHRWKLLYTSATEALHKKGPSDIRLSQYQHYLSIVCNHHYFMRKNLRRPINHLAFWWAMVGIFLNCIVLLVVRPTRASMDGLRGFLKGVVEVAGSYYRS